ncbi:MAG: hypothetical protein NVS1B6_00970 [Steroidobacteraceae bacterium]
MMKISERKIFRHAIEEGLRSDPHVSRKQGAVVASPRDAFILRRLRAAGALILGKGNLSEWAGQRSNYASGGCGRGGQTRKPYAPDCSPAGSSSGLAVAVAVAVAADLTAVAIDPDTGGSIWAPASANGAVGIRPTIGLVSRSGFIPVAASDDTAGPLTRTVADAATLGFAYAFEQASPSPRPSGRLQ